MSTEPNDLDPANRPDGVLPPGPWDETTHILSLAELEAALGGDRVIIEYQEKTKQHQENIDRFEKEKAERFAELELLANEEADLRARMKVIDRQKREIRGRITWLKYSVTTSLARITEVAVRTTRRRKKVWQMHLNQRLREIGKGISWNVGRKKPTGTDSSFEIRDVETIRNR